MPENFVPNLSLCAAWWRLSAQSARLSKLQLFLWRTETAAAAYELCTAGVSCRETPSVCQLPLPSSVIFPQRWSQLSLIFLKLHFPFTSAINCQFMRLQNLMKQARQNPIFVKPLFLTCQKNQRWLSNLMPRLPVLTLYRPTKLQLQQVKLSFHTYMDVGFILPLGMQLIFNNYINLF